MQMERLCKFIYARDRTDRIRTCAILCHIYHHALHDRWYQARDLMLMSHLQDNIQHADPPVQVRNRDLDGRSSGAAWKNKQSSQSIELVVQSGCAEAYRNEVV